MNETTELKPGDRVRVRTGGSFRPMAGQVGVLREAKDVPYGYTVFFDVTPPMVVPISFAYHLDELEAAQ